MLFLSITQTEGACFRFQGGTDVTTEELFQEVYSRFKMHFYKEVFRNFENREATLTTVETFCMEVIYAMKNPTVNEFASFIQISSPNAAYKINSLVKKGYLMKIQSKTDRREYHLQPTQKYIDYYNVSTNYVDLVLARVKETMTEKENEDFRRTLEIILEQQKADLPHFPADPTRHVMQKESGR
jgi:DNA-binding MarR family transcriptional regulator